ncbi:MAG: hypothetical protein CL547_11710 [Alcanivorax sp.]|jgi:hypothetical protein|nr:hypothetical protein [Alcanivorax sp.]
MTDLERSTDFSAIEQVLTDGNLQALTSEQRCLYVQRLCESIGVNPMVQPFQFIRFQGRTVLYATRGCTDQLRRIHGVSLEILKNEVTDGTVTVHVRASMPDSRQPSGLRLDEDYGEVVIGKGTDAINNRLKAVTKAKRRVTLSLCGLSVLDESELHTMPPHEQLETPAVKADPVPNPVPQQKPPLESRDALAVVRAKIEKGKAKPESKPKPRAKAKAKADSVASNKIQFSYEPIPEIPGG